MATPEWHGDKMPGHYFSRIARGMTRVGDMRLKPIGFASAQLPVLSALSKGQSLSQTDLARRAKVEQPTMAQLLARMERDHIVQRAPDPADRRSSLISLTDQALAKIPEARAILVQGNKEVTRGLSEAEIATLMDLLQRVLANIEAMEG